MHRLLTFTILSLVLLSQENAFAGHAQNQPEISTAKEFYYQIMVPLNIHYHKIENDMMKMLVEDPVDDFIQNDEAPIIQRIEYLSENVTTTLEANGTEALRLLIFIRKEDDAIGEQLKYLDHKHKSNIALRDERKETIESKMNKYTEKLEAALKLQTELDIDEELDDDFTKKFKNDGLNITTPTAILQFKKTIRHMEKLAGDMDKGFQDMAKDLLDSVFVRHLKEYKDPYQVDETESNSEGEYAELNKKLVETLIQEQNNKLTPSNLIKTMLEIFKERREEFDTQLFWKYDSMASKYMRHAMKNLVAKYNAVIENMNKLEAKIEEENKELIDAIEEAKFYKKNKIVQIENRDEL